MNSQSVTRPWGLPEEEALHFLARRALDEDLNSPDGRRGDATSLALVPEGLLGQAWFVSRVEGRVAGLPALKRIFELVDSTAEVTITAPEGGSIRPGDRLAKVAGPMRALLAGERTALNFLQRLSGVATQAEKYVRLVNDLACVVLDTRKTTPGWRVLEKYAVRMGGATNHRMGLGDGILIKDNHLAALSGTAVATPAIVARATRQAGEYAREHPGLSVEVEVDNLEQFEAVLAAGPDVILLDNFTLEMLKKAVALRDRAMPAVRLEASGGVRLETLRAVAQTGVDRVSIGALTHQATSIDIGLDYEPPAA
ncbi:MAG: carboxylating nicotinate-nucleotide diphosphorylase [Planctomycetota bacterium]